MIVTLALANTSISSHNYYFFFAMRTFQIHCLGNFQVYNVELLIIITILYVNSPELNCLITASFWPASPHFLHPFILGNHHSTLCLYECDYSDASCKWNGTAFVQIGICSWLLVWFNNSICIQHPVREEHRETLWSNYSFLNERILYFSFLYKFQFSTATFDLQV